MTVIRADVLGFCMGVRRAVDLTTAEVKRAEKNGSSVYTLGQLIHNQRVLGELRVLGVRAAGELPENGENSSVIIRAHGISPVIEKKIRQSNYHVVDATCPNVKSNQLKARELIRAGYSLFIAGDANHAEITGILGYAQDADAQDADAQMSFCETAGSAEEAGKAAEKLYSKNNNAKTAIIAQTTICEEEFYSIRDAVKKYFPLLETVNTICAATKDRQNALRGLLNQADAVIIAGGKESANTLRLLAIANDSGKPCALCESAADIPAQYFCSFEKIGLCAGASTPGAVIDEIEQALQNSADCAETGYATPRIRPL